MKQIIIQDPNATGGGGASFLADPDLVDDASAVYFYWGWAVANGGWLVRRQLRASSSFVDATAANNAGIADLATAWASRASLSYS